MIPTWSEPDDHTVVLAVPAQLDGPTCAVVVRFTEAHDLPDHLYPMLRVLVPTVQALAVRIAHQHDVEQAVRDLEDDASRDTLTGLWNRRPMAKTGHRAAGTGVLLLDIDHFKKVNDTFGHSVGDDVLRQLAVALTGATRSTDQVIRFGGEEFVVLVADADAEIIARTAERLRVAVETSVRTPSGTVTVSIGVAVIDDGDDLDAALERADTALYAAKDQGRNRVVIHDDTVQRSAQN
jgi:diguanylate cyclase (GGDEF)-like protein